MIKTKNLLLILAISLFLVFSVNSIFAMNDYDSTVYKVGSVYKTSYTGLYVLHSNPNIEISHYNDYRFKESCHTKSGYSCYQNKREVKEISYSQHKSESTRRGFMGDYVKEYSVDVMNRGKTGRYFSVIFEFEDKDGQEFSQSVTQYLRTGESKKFVYRDIQYEKNEILDWGYTIVH